MVYSGDQLMVEAQYKQSDFGCRKLQWGVGSGEKISIAAVKISALPLNFLSPLPTPHSPLPTPHSPLPTPHFLASKSGCRYDYRHRGTIFISEHLLGNQGYVLRGL
jgi:hypothetical protein